MPRCLYQPSTRGTCRPSISQNVSSSLHSIHPSCSSFIPVRHSAPCHPVLSPVGLPSLSVSIPTTNPSPLDITDITVNITCSVLVLSHSNAPSSANHACGVRFRCTPFGVLNAHPATSHSIALVSTASGSIDLVGPSVSPWPFPTCDSVPGVSPLPESYCTTRHSCSAMTISVTSTCTLHLASIVFCILRTTDWKNPPLSQYPRYHAFRSLIASSFMSPMAMAVCAALPPGLNPVFADGCTARCAPS